MTGRRVARSRTICHAAPPTPITIDARSSRVGIGPARRISPTSRRLCRCSGGLALRRGPAQVDDALDAGTRSRARERFGGAALELAKLGFASAHAVHEVVCDLNISQRGRQGLLAAAGRRHATLRF